MDPPQQPTKASTSTFENQNFLSTPSRPEDIDPDPNRKKKAHPTLKEASPAWHLRVGMPTALLAVPIAYLVLLGTVIFLSGRQQCSFGDATLEVLQLASTLWPISFAAVIGPFLKTLALFGAERGSTLGSLEFLMTSQTTIAALKNLFSLQYVRIWTIAIVAMWLFSPLGGQAAVRSLYLQTKSQSIQVPAVHYVSNIPLGVDRRYGINIMYGRMFPIGSLKGSLLSDLRRSVLASFSGPDILISHSNGSSDGFDAVVARLGGASQAARLAQRDIWRNVRMPFMEYLPGYDEKNPTAWVSVPSDEVVPYASFIGLPIRGGSFPRAGNSSLVLHSRYQVLKCSDDFEGTSWIRANETHMNLLFHDPIAVSGPLQSQTMDDTDLAMTRPNIWFDIVNTTASRLHFNRILDFTQESQLQLIAGGEYAGKSIVFKLLCYKPSVFMTYYPS